MEEEDQIILPPLIENGVTLPSIKPFSRTLPTKALDAKTASREEIIDAFSNLSGVPFFIVLKGLGINFPDQSQSTKDLLRTEEQTNMDTISSAAYSVVYTTNAVNDQPIDVEPTTISITKGDRYSTTTYTTSAYIKNPKTLPRIYYSTSTTPSTGFTYKAQLHPTTGEYTYSADPLAAQNGYTRGGIAPGRQYISGITFNPNQIIPGVVGERYGTPNSIAVWRSEDGGYTWAWKEAVRNNDYEFFLDKPAIAVSEHSGTRGYVYIAYVKHRWLSSGVQSKSV